MGASITKRSIKCKLSHELKEMIKFNDFKEKYKCCVMKDIDRLSMELCVYKEQNAVCLIYVLKYAPRNR